MYYYDYIAGTIIFQKQFTSAVATTGKIYCRVDNTAFVYFNSALIGQNLQTELLANINILQGTNTISIVATNTVAGAAGLIASVYSDSSASFIVKTDSTWTWTYGGIILNKLLLLFLSISFLVGTWSAVGSSSCSADLCQSGFYCPGDGTKQSCPSGFITTTTGAASNTQCICPSGYYKSGSTCTQCPSGKITLTAGATSLAQCGKT